MYTNIHIYTHIYTHIRTCVYAYMYIHIYNIYAYIYIYIYTHTYIRMNIYIHIYIHTYTYTYTTCHLPAYQNSTALPLWQCHNAAAVLKRRGHAGSCTDLHTYIHKCVYCIYMYTYTFVYTQRRLPACETPQPCTYVY